MPQALNKKIGELLDIGQGTNQKAKANKQRGKMAAEPTALYNAPKNAKEYQQQIKKLEQQMYKILPKILEFEKAAAISRINYINCVNSLFLITKRNASLSWRSIYLFSPEEYKRFLYK